MLIKATSGASAEEDTCESLLDFSLSSIEGTGYLSSIKGSILSEEVYMDLVMLVVARLSLPLFGTSYPFFISSISYYKASSGHWSFYNTDWVQEMNRLIPTSAAGLSSGDYRHNSQLSSKCF